MISLFSIIHHFGAGNFPFGGGDAKIFRISTFSKIWKLMNLVAMLCDFIGHEQYTDVTDIAGFLLQIEMTNSGDSRVTSYQLCVSKMPKNGKMKLLACCLFKEKLVVKLFFKDQSIHSKVIAEIMECGNITTNQSKTGTTK